MAAKKRGAKPAERNPLDAKVRALEAQVARLEHELHTAHTILDVQGKVAGLLGFEAQVARLEHELHTAHTILDVQGKVAGLLGLNLEHGTRS